MSLKASACWTIEVKRITYFSDHSCGDHNSSMFKVYKVVGIKKIKIFIVNMYDLEIAWIELKSQLVWTSLRKIYTLRLHQNLSEIFLSFNYVVLLFVLLMVLLYSQMGGILIIYPFHWFFLLI